MRDIRLFTPASYGVHGGLLIVIQHLKLLAALVLGLGGLVVAGVACSGALVMRGRRPRDGARVREELLRLRDGRGLGSVA